MDGFAREEQRRPTATAKTRERWDLGSLNRPMDKANKKLEFDGVETFMC